MIISEAAEKLCLEILSMPAPEREINGGYVGDLLSWVMGRAEADNVWITIMTNINVIAVASLSDVCAIVIAENAEIGADVVEKAKEQGINLLRSKKAAFEVALEFGRLIGM